MQERIHPHIDRRTRELVETLPKLKFVITPKDGYVEVICYIVDVGRLLEIIPRIWKKQRISILYMNEKIARIRIIDKEK